MFPDGLPVNALHSAAHLVEIAELFWPRGRCPDLACGACEAPPATVAVQHIESPALGEALRFAQTAYSECQTRPDRGDGLTVSGFWWGFCCGALAAALVSLLLFVLLTVCCASRRRGSTSSPATVRPTSARGDPRPPTGGPATPTFRRALRDADAGH